MPISQTTLSSRLTVARLRDRPKVNHTVSKCIASCRDDKAIEETLNLSRRDGRHAYRAAHSMKSSSAGMGAAQVQSLATRIEGLMCDEMTHDEGLRLPDRRERCQRIIDIIQWTMPSANESSE